MQQNAVRAPDTEELPESNGFWFCPWCSKVVLSEIRLGEKAGLLRTSAKLTIAAGAVRAPGTDHE